MLIKSNSSIHLILGKIISYMIRFRNVTEVKVYFPNKSLILYITEEKHLKLKI